MPSMDRSDHLREWIGLGDLRLIMDMTYARASLDGGLGMNTGKNLY